MDTQTMFTIVGAVAGVGTVMIAITIPIFKALFENVALRLELKIATEIDTKLERYKQETSAEIDTKLERYKQETSAEIDAKLERYKQETSAEIDTKLERYRRETSAKIDKLEKQQIHIIESLDTIVKIIEEYGVVKNG